VSSGPRLAFALALGAAGAFAAHTGWFSPPRPWWRVTGWEGIPAVLRPPVPGASGAAAGAGTKLPWPGGAGEAPHLTWLGHAGFLLEWHGLRLLLDPNLNERCTVVRRVMVRPLAPGDLGRIDAALISHAHYDHLDLPTLRGVPRLGTVVVPAGSEGYVAGLRPATAVRGLAAGESLDLGGVEIEAVPAFHHGNRFHPLASRKLAVGYVLRSPGDGPEASLYFAGDTGPGLDFAALGAAYRPSVAILPIGAFSPRWPIGRVHLDPEQAAAAGRALGAKVVVPCHFGTFALALDRPGAALPRFARAARREGLSWVMPRLAGGPMGRSDGPR